jgi:hypothetical protein
MRYGRESSKRDRRKTVIFVYQKSRPSEKPEWEEALLPSLEGSQT